MMQHRLKLGTQNFRLWNLLMNGRTINPLESWKELGIYRLASRINDIRKGIGVIVYLEVSMRWIKINNQFGEPVRFAEYYMTQAAISSARYRWRTEEMVKEQAAL